MVEAYEASANAEVSNIQREMAQARRQIHEDVGGAIDGVQTLTDWRSLVRAHPWLSLGIAAALGYLVVPRRPAAGLAEAVEAQPQLARDGRGAPTIEPATRHSDAGKWALLSSGFAVISPIVIRLAQSYALRYLESWLERHTDVRH
jgi:hypothetical protein